MARFFAFMIVLLMSFAGLGCTSAVQSGHNTALDTIDLIRMTDQMAASIASNGQVRAAIQEKGRLSIVVQPVVNEMQAEILPQGEAQAFTARVRALLSKHNPNDFRWIMNRDAYYRLRQQELDVDLGPAPDAINPEYALTARFRSLSDESSAHRTSAYLCVYELSNLKTRTILWADQYEVNKRAVKGFLD